MMNGREGEEDDWGRSQTWLYEGVEAKIGGIEAREAVNL